MLASSPQNSNLVNVFDVANYILARKRAMTAMKLQKLVYYCQAWSLVWDGEPLFPEKIEAWSNGPVVRELFNAHKGQFLVSPFASGDPNRLNDSQKGTVEAVLDYYGAKSSQWLSDLTHLEKPWREARAGIPDNVRSAWEITLASMEEYYSSLLPES